jgi:hypothetical protein
VRARLMGWLGRGAKIIGARIDAVLITFDEPSGSARFTSTKTTARSPELGLIENHQGAEG